MGYNILITLKNKKGDQDMPQVIIGTAVALFLVANIKVVAAITVVSGAVLLLSSANSK